MGDKWAELRRLTGGPSGWPGEGESAGEVTRRPLLIADLLAERDELVKACREALAITEDRQAGTYDDIMRLMRTALKGEF